MAIHPTIEIRRCRREDFSQVAALSYRTGYGGEDVAASGLFTDRLLFELLFCRPYLRFELESCFVAAQRGAASRIAGYVLGCPDSARHELLFRRWIVPRVLGRIAVHTMWRDRATVFELLRWGRDNPWRTANPAGPDFPAHLHIGVLPDLQGQGIGGLLLTALEDHLRARGVPGVHLVTSSHHRKAIPFYEKHGYRRLLERSHRMWSGLADYRSLVFVKSLEAGEGATLGR